MFANSFALIALNTAAALFILARYIDSGLSDPNQKRWLQALAVPGGVAILLGSPLLRGWLLGGIAGSNLDVMSAIIGLFFLGLAAFLWRGWSLLPLGVYAVLTGLVAILTGILLLTPGGSLLLGPGLILAGFGCFIIPRIIQSDVDEAGESDVLDDAHIRRLHGSALFAKWLFIFAAIFWLLAGFGGIIEAMNHVQRLSVHISPLG